MSEILIRVEERISDLERQCITDGLGQYNEGRVPSRDHRELNVISRHEGKMIGGLTGHTHWKWLHIKNLWVAEDFRGKGTGRALMQAAENEASKRGCLHAHCDTYEFQALSFYQKLGYVIFGTLDDYPEGQARYFLQKRNLTVSP